MIGYFLGIGALTAEDLRSGLGGRVEFDQFSRNKDSLESPLEVCPDVYISGVAETRRSDVLRKCAAVLGFAGVDLADFWVIDADNVRYRTTNDGCLIQCG